MWSREEHQRLLQDSGGGARIAAHAQARGEDVDAAAVHRTKSETGITGQVVEAVRLD